MSTHALIKIKNYEGITLVNIYKHYDGYIQGLGNDLVTLLQDKKLVNGLTGQENEINGIEDLAAYIVWKLKTKPGDVYIYPIDSDIDVEYIYYIRPKNRYEISIKVLDKYTGEIKELM